MKAVAVVALAILALTGCSATPEPTPAPTVDASGSTTIAQWASVVAEQKATFEEWKTDWDSELCSVDASDFACAARTLTGTFIAQTISITLTTAVTPTALTGYLADEPPAEIKTLWTDTTRAADDFMAAGKVWSDSCNANAQAEGCDVVLFKFGSAADALERKFAAWSPYL